jgi:hypothetical protein
VEPARATAPVQAVKLEELEELEEAPAPSKTEKVAAPVARHESRTRTRMYLCRDGTPSPSCVCGGPKRGCCSHHGGVAGCE